MYFISILGKKLRYVKFRRILLGTLTEIDTIGFDFPLQ